MSDLSDLKLVLNRALEVRLEPPGTPEVLTRQIEALQGRLQGSSHLAPPHDAQYEAIHEFRSTGEIHSLSAAKCVCYGAAKRFSGISGPLIEHPIFPSLFQLIDRHRSAPRQFRRCYNGLIDTYFFYDYVKAPLPGLRHWELLRTYLAEHCAAIQADGVTPDWVATITANQNLLTSDPVSKYGRKLLRGRNSEVEAIRSHLGIDQKSWFERALVLAPIQASTQENDDQFKSRVSGFLEVLATSPGVEDDGLRLLLDRYSTITNRPEHADLRDRALKQWGTPSLTKNEVLWSRVTPSAREMVTQWFKRDLIRSFFEVLSEDRLTDKRRVEFWLRYHDRIGDMYFALGPKALGSTSTDMVALRNKMAGLRLYLTAGGVSHNNAFIMKMGKYLVVEFGATGNACFVFESETAPFSLRGSIAGDATGLKHESRIHRLLHIDSPDFPWERKFDSVLASCGVTPDRAERSRASRPKGANTASAGANTEKRAEILSYFNQKGLLWGDKTLKGGNLSVAHNRVSGSVADQLREWGFQYSQRGFWYCAEWPT